MVITNAKISYICGILPSNKINNCDNELFECRIKNRIIQSSGVKNRYVLNRKNNESILNLFIKAGQHVIDELSWDKNSIKGIIVVSQTHEYRFPVTAALLQDKLGINNNCFAYDVVMGCSGYTYGLFCAMSHINVANDKILLFVGDTINDFVYPKNKSVAFLFSDGASCTALEYSKDESFKNTFMFETFGDKSHLIIARDGGNKNPINPSSFQEFIDDDGNVNIAACMQMKGVELFDFMCNTVPNSILNFMKNNNFEVVNTEKLFLHQANVFALKEIARKLDIIDKMEELMPINIHKYGNASCASIPILMSEQGKINSKNVLLSGFGVGISICSLYIAKLECSTKLL
ncbi:ketoacyl-ACP synthase III, partial [Campylobacter jejuni]|nr:ketoacyl-ACP synthase III [Campylobacter coli]EAH7909570.1 ketoacyl-ACP synthase III [Campylobacter jejuni]EAI7966290.1 ketoacyl-ACP synthase III [Campylobacter coli]EAI8099458.1 ketoacyl-ACP synthase III [Campylobacter coli]EAJ4153207.1 ketoacyl-ACP synthase III [Campylobacter coli]